MFKWPNVFDIWNTYLSKFIGRYVSTCFFHLVVIKVMASSSRFLLLFSREEVRLNVQETCLNKYWMDALQSSRKVNKLFLHFFSFLVIYFNFIFPDLEYICSLVHSNRESGVCFFCFSS